MHRCNVGDCTQEFAKNVWLYLQKAKTHWHHVKLMLSEQVCRLSSARIHSFRR